MAAQAELKNSEDAEYHIEQNIYDCDELGPLETYINSQVSQSVDYDFDTNLYVLKMYSLYPSKAVVDIVCKILIKSLMNLPSSDFTSLVYLIPITVDNDQSIRDILDVGKCLEDCNFDKFWQLYKHKKETFQDYTNFEFEIRKCLLIFITSFY